jgi:hypothetical protein
MNKMKRKPISLLVLVSFVFNLMLPYQSHAQMVAGMQLPAPRQMVMPSGNTSLPVLKGLKLNPKNPLQIDFIIDSKGAGVVSKKEVERLVKYFLAALAVAKEDVWVNLSPYEQNRIVPETLGLTDLGKDLLGQDYILKQLASSLTYPESELGKKYWQASSSAQSFNRVWIVPAKSSIYENKDTALISEATMAVKTEEDYLAMKNNGQTQRFAPTNVFKTQILPVIEKEVNNGSNFANLRQIYNSLVLATWFKQKFFNSFYRNYINQQKINGVIIDDKTAKEKIYALYVEAFQKGVYNYVKTEQSNFKRTRRAYFSGGFAAGGMQVTPGHKTDGGDVVATVDLKPSGAAYTGNHDDAYQARLKEIIANSTAHIIKYNSREEFDDPIILPAIRALGDSLLNLNNHRIFNYSDVIVASGHSIGGSSLLAGWSACWVKASGQYTDVDDATFDADAKRVYVICPDITKLSSSEFQRRVIHEVVDAAVRKYFQEKGMYDPKDITAYAYLVHALTENFIQSHGDIYYHDSRLNDDVLSRMSVEDILKLSGYQRKVPQSVFVIFY